MITVRTVTGNQYLGTGIFNNLDLIRERTA